MIQQYYDTKGVFTILYDHGQKDHPHRQDGCYEYSYKWVCQREDDSVIDRLYRFSSTWKVVYRIE